VKVEVTAHNLNPNTMTLHVTPKRTVACSAPLFIELFMGTFYKDKIGTPCAMTLIHEGKCVYPGLARCKNESLRIDSYDKLAFYFEAPFAGQNAPKDDQGLLHHIKNTLS
jgi:hypothetical protein